MRARTPITIPKLIAAYDPVDSLDFEENGEEELDATMIADDALDDNDEDGDDEDGEDKD
jgi:hypothetical protein